MSSCGCLRLVLAKLVDRRASSCHHHCMCLDRSVSSYDRHCIALAELLDRSMPSCIVCHHCIVLVQLLEKSASSCHRHCMCLDRSVSSFCHHCIALAQLLNRGVPSCYHHCITLAQLLDRSVLSGCHHCIALAQLLDRTASPCHSSACTCTVMGSACSAAAAIKMIGLHGVETRECVELSAGRKTTFLRAPAEDGSPQL